jgi:hypothetical protein
VINLLRIRRRYISCPYLILSMRGAEDTG